MIYLILVFWYILGVSGFVFWWTKDNDLTNHELIIIILVGLTGPFSWLFGYSLHGEKWTIAKRR